MLDVEKCVCLLNNFKEIKKCHWSYSLIKDEPTRLGMSRLAENRDELTSV